jgi:hypothetical protein
MLYYIGRRGVTELSISDNNPMLLFYAARLNALFKSEFPTKFTDHER